MHQLETNIRQDALNILNYKILLVTLCLVSMGLILLYSADHALDVASHFNRQLYFTVIGLVVLGIASAVTWRVYYTFAYFAYILAIIGLLLVPVAGIIGFGARRWITLGLIHIQPSEPAKIAFILATARLLSFKHLPIDWWKLTAQVSLIALPVLLLVAMQPDLGTSTVFLVVAAAMLAWFGLPLKIFVLLLSPVFSLFVLANPWIVLPVVGTGLIWLWNTGIRGLGMVLLCLLCLTAAFAGPFAWNQLEPYQQKRLTSFLDPTADPLGSGYQVIQSKVAVGSGGILGQGYLEGTQTQLRFLPQQHTDFIFAIAGEEFGFFGTSVIIGLYFALALIGFTQAAHAKNEFMMLVSVGITTMILYHAVINIGMALGALPVTGLPLPFISYGGSFLITCMAGSGLLLSTVLHRKE